MRALLLFPVAFLAFAAIVVALAMVTGDALSALLVALLLLVSLAGWLAGPLDAAGGMRARS